MRNFNILRIVVVGGGESIGKSI